MPMYTITAQAGLLDEAAKVGLAGRLTARHAEVAGVPKSWVHVVFQDYSPGSGFSAGLPAAPVALFLTIRTGRSPAYKRALLQQLWDEVQGATGAADDRIVIGIQEVPPDQAMEMGRIMPDVGS